MRFEGSNGEKILYALFDSGSTFSCIHPNYAEEIGHLEKMFRPMEVSTASEGYYLKIAHRISSNFYCSDVRMSDEFMVVPNLSEDAITGVTTMQKLRIKLDL